LAVAVEIQRIVSFFYTYDGSSGRGSLYLRMYSAVYLRTSDTLNDSPFLKSIKASNFLSDEQLNRHLLFSQIRPKVFQALT